MTAHILLAHPGTQHARRLARELERHRLLGEFWTGVAIAGGGGAARLASLLATVPRFKGLANRVVPGVPARRLRRVAWNEMTALARLDRGAEPLRTLHERNQRFQRAIPDASLAACTGLIGFDTSAWLLAERAAALRKGFFLDRTIGHPAAWERIQTDLHRDFPDWCPVPLARPAWLVEAEGIEHQLARRIVVAGSFARATLLEAGIAADRIVLNPYGVDWDEFGVSARPVASRPLRFLFLGSHLARKGLPVLLAAWRALGPRRGDAELWLAGPCHARIRKLIPELPGLRVLGQVPHSRVSRLLQQADVFVLPSYFEGFGLVLLEALAAGLPFIATPATGVVDLPPNPALGRVVPAGSVEALQSALLHYVDHPPSPAGVQAATQPLTEEFSWRAYGDRWARILTES